jgi:DNA replication and repair protein RecF
MRLTQLKLSHFRNISALALTLPDNADLVALIGANGSGKTSVLESISLLTPTRGMLTADAKSQIQHGAKEWGIWVQLHSGAELGQVYRKSERVLQIDGHREALESTSRHGSIVWLTPNTDFLFSGPPANRRRWLDDLTTALIPTHAGACQRFTQHRQSRLKLLTEGRGGDWLDAEERLAAEWGIQVLRNRIDYLHRLQPLLNGVSLALTGTALEVMDSENPIAALKGKFERSREIDARMGRTHAGPNTLDIAGVLTLENGHNVKLSEASSGQHKRGLIQWLVGHVQLLAQAQNRPPLVLVDEFSAHLDAKRRADLLTTLTTAGCQVWLTDTDVPNITLPNLHIIHMQDGLATDAS